MDHPDPSVFGSWRFARLVEKPLLCLARVNALETQRLLISASGNDAFCPFSGPYLHYHSEGSVNHEAFFKSALDQLKARGFKRLFIKLPPESYFTWVKDISALLKAVPGAKVVLDHNYHLDVRQADLITFLPADQRRVLRLSTEAGYSCSFSTDWPLIHRVVSESRTGKGFADAISLKSLQELADAFPSNYKGVTCSVGREIAGAGVLIKVNSEIAYLFYVANTRDHLRFSPSLQIIRFCYSWASHEGIQILDLGTASKDGVVNQGVSSFKKSLGGVLTRKDSLTIPL